MGYSFLTCVCYLVPAHSSYQVNANDFFDNLLCQISRFQDIGSFYICGDFNARCGDATDFIEGVDNLPIRTALDFTHNAYSDVFIDFLINVNCCIVNGRNSIQDDFTYVSTRGSSVVDYCLVPYENLFNISNFSVKRASSLATETGAIGQVDPVSKIPDHSFLCWSFGLDFSFTASAKASYTTYKTKYDVRNIPDCFLADENAINALEQTICQLESNSQDQLSIDNAYGEFCNLIKSTMENKLDKKSIKIEHGVSNKKRRIKKAWWNEELSALWNETCFTEKEWLKEKCPMLKKKLKSVFIVKRKEFDRAVRKNKRSFKKT